MKKLKRLTLWILTIGLLSTLNGCWFWHWPHHGGGSGGSGGAGGSAGSGGSGGEGATCAPTDQFLLVTREVSGDCGPIDDEVVTSGDPGWVEPSYDEPCVIDGCHITCDRAYDSPTFDVTQELDLMLGDNTVDNPMTISQVDTGANPYSCESNYLVDVTRVPSMRRLGPVLESAAPVALRMSVMTPAVRRAAL